MEFIDIEMSQNSQGILDISFEDGDIKSVSGFESALLLSILVEKRATASEIGAPQFRRGWWGNEALGFDDYEMGSKLWLLSQHRRNTQGLNQAITFARDSLQWLLDDNLIDEIRVSANYGTGEERDVLNLNIDLLRSQNSVLSRGFKIWQNTSKVIIT